jgi:hypothetical protein
LVGDDAFSCLNFGLLVLVSGDPRGCAASGLGWNERKFRL